MSQTCVIYHPKFATHGNLVLRERLTPAYNSLMGFLKENDRDTRVVIQTPERVEEQLILQIHTEQHLARVKEDACYDAALLSAGGAVLANLPSFELDQDVVEENLEDTRTADKIINKFLKDMM